MVSIPSPAAGRPAAAASAAMPAAERVPLLNGFAVPALVPGLLLVGALLALFQYGFRQYIPGSIEVGGFTLDNAARLARPIYFRVFVDSLWYAGLTATGALLLGYPLAFALVRSSSSVFRSIVLIVAISPLFTSDIVRNYAWLVVLGKNGLVNSTLLALGVVSQPLAILYTPVAVVIALIQHAIPVMVVILAAALSHIDPRYERAAEGLGAGPLRIFLHVTLPLSLPGILSGVVTIFAWTLSAFATPQLVGGGRVTMIANLVYNAGFSSFNLPFAAMLSLAALVLTMLVLGGLTLLARRLERLGGH